MRTRVGAHIPHRDQVLAPRHLSIARYTGNKHWEVFGYRGEEGDCHHMNSAGCAADRSADRRHVTITLPKLKFMGDE